MRRPRRLALAGALAAVAIAAGCPGGHPGLRARAWGGPPGAEPPHALIDARPVPQRGRVLPVAAGGNLQAVLDGARGGDTVLLPAGSTFRGPLTLPVITGEGWLEIRSTGADDLPPGRRVTPADASRMARIVGGKGSDAPLRPAAAAPHRRLVGM